MIRTESPRKNGRIVFWLACLAMSWMAAGCGAQSNDTGSGGMFSFFKKDAEKSATAVHPEVGGPLTRGTSFPASRASVVPARTPRQLALDGVPPQAKFLDQPIAGQTTTAYLIDGASGRPPLAFVNINAGQQGRFELWETGSGDKPAFVRKRTVNLEPAQASWITYYVAGVANLPEKRFLLAVFYYAPQVKQALYVYDSTGGSYTKIANVVPDSEDREKFFEAQLVAPDAVIVKYATNTIRLAPEIYYNTPTHLRLFSPRHPQGINVLQLSAADGSVERWTVLDKTLWLEAKDSRQRNKPKDYVWSLNLERAAALTVRPFMD